MGLLLTTVGTALATLLCLLAGLVYRKAAANKPIAGLPLAPDAHWLWGHGKLYMNYCDMSIRYIKSLGPFVCMYHPITGPALLSASAEVVDGLFKDRKRVRQNAAVRSVFSSFFPNGMICLEGDVWRKHVRVLGPMLGAERLKAALPVMLAAVRDVETKWGAKLLLEPAKPLDVSHDLQALSLAVIADFMLGLTYGGNAGEVLRRCETVLGNIKVFDGLKSKLYRAVFGDPPAAREAKSFLRGLVLEIMAECRRTPEAKEHCAIGQILAAVEAEGVDFSDEELMDEVVMIVFASHDTTATSLMWFLKLLSQFPEVQDKLRAELNKVLPRGTDPTYEDVNTRLPYLDLCIKELMRLAPTAPGTSRTLTTSVEVPGRPGVVLKQGTTVALAIAAMHRLPDYWIDPERLWPERWEEGEGKGQAAHGLPINHSAYAPFGVGQRACFGSRLAMLELKVLLCQLLRAFRFETTGDPLFDSMDTISRLTSRPKQPVVRVIAIRQ